MPMQERRRLREVENDWWTGFACEIQSFADTNNIHKFYEAVTAAVGHRRRPSTPVRSSTGELVRGREGVLDRWREHFSGLLNEATPFDASILDELPSLPVSDHLWPSPDRDEVLKIIQGLKNNKSPGPDGVPAELLKCGPPELVDLLFGLIQHIWETGAVPQQWKDANLVTIYKNKGDRAVCGNSMGIALLAVAGKVLAKVLIRRVATNIGEKLLPESQCGFRPGRGTCDMVFVVRQLQEKTREQQRGIHMAFVDLSKAFDRVPRVLLWNLLSRFGCPSRVVGLIRSFHDGMKVRVSTSGALSDEFSVTVGVKQGCVMAPVLFNIFMLGVTYILHRDAGGEGIGLRYRFDRSLFDLSKLKAKTKTRLEQIYELQYADDAAIVAHSPEALQKMIDIIHNTYNRMGLKMNTDKTEVLRGGTPITVGSAQLGSVRDFKYLGSYLSDDCTIEKEITYRIGRSAASFGSLRDRVFSNRDLRMATKVKVYSAVCVSTLLYGSEAWTLYRRQIRKLESYHVGCLQKILGITWKDRVTHNDILSRTGCVSIECLIAERQLRWTGHVVRMDDSRLP